jgi:hypothetical protein
MCLSEVYNKALTCKYLFDTFHTQNCLKQENASLALLSNIALEYAIVKGGESKKGLELNGTHPLVVCADDENLLGENTNTV